MRFSFTNSSSVVKKSRGFTLVELLVALGIFSIIITISLGSILSIIDAGRKSQSLNSVMTNLNFTMDVMSREIKFGKHYYCGIDISIPHVLSQDCTGAVIPPGNSITFTTSDGIDTIYRLNTVTNQVEKSVDHGLTYIGVTSPEINVQQLSFYIFGTTPFSPTNDTSQPRVFIIIRGFAGTKVSSQSTFIIQTVLSQRSLDS